MNILLRERTPVLSRAGLNLLMTCIFAGVIASCGGDSGVSLGSGQSADPVVVDYPMFYVKRPLPTDDTGALVQTDVREVLTIEFGAELYMRPRALGSAPETNLTGAITGGMGDIRDVSVSHDGSRVLFSMRFPVDPDADEEEQPAWNIWEYDIGNDELSQVMSGLAATEGDDIGPVYLPDDRIVFSSTRQNQSMPKLSKLPNGGRAQFAALDENQNEPAFVLHVMKDDGTGLEQISFNQSHDLFPTVLDNGRIMFSRWDSAGNRDSMALYSVNPDGTDMQLLYGADSHATGSPDAGGNPSIVQFLKPKEMQNGRVVALLAPYSGTSGGGDIVVIDTQNYLNNTQPNQGNVGLTGPAQQPSPRSRAVTTVPGISPGGRFTSIWPLWDGTDRAFVSWSLCRYHDGDPTGPVLPCNDNTASNPQAIEAQPGYGVYVYNFASGNLSPVLLQDPGFMYTDVVIAQPRTIPVWIPDQNATGTADTVLAGEQAGVLHIRSVYDIDGSDPYDYRALANPAITAADERPARFVRIYKATAIPDEETLDFDFSAFGVTRAFGMREIIGYAPVEPDGSVMVKVPADVPLAIDVLDSQGRRLPAFPRHQNWIQVRPGEVRECNGCHDPSVPELSHGRSDAFAAANAGAAFPGDNIPNTNIGASAATGETMAANRARYCEDPGAACNSLDMSLSLLFADPWTIAPETPDPALESTLAYDGLDGVDGLTTTFPEYDLDKCAPWTVDCRVIINYEEHIQPLWGIARDAIDPDPAAVVKSCIDCHALRDANNALIDPADRGQLELTSNPSDQDVNQYKSYRELLSNDTAEASDGTAISIVTQPRLDASGNPVLDDNDVPIEDPVNVAASMSINGAAASAAFFNRFTSDMGTVSHNGWLSDAEMLLIAEWLDLGAQYFNDPFKAPPAN